MEEKSLKNGYRSLHSKEKTEWKQFASLDEFIWDDVCAISISVDDGRVGLPFESDGDEIIHLIVKDQTRKASNQNDRIIVQTLTRVKRLTGHVFTYTRTRRYLNGEHKWGDWLRIDGSGAAAVVNHADTAVSILPNVLNLWGEVESLEITLAAPVDESVANEYMIQFTSGEVATTLVLPSEVKWIFTPEIQANKVYHISILNNLAVIGGFNNE